jgi:hypothetical protein
MARQGGDNRAFTSPHGRDLLYARLVLEAMCNDTTEAGKRFAKEREDLYLRWHRLIRTIIAAHFVGGLAKVLAALGLPGTDPADCT